MNKNEKPDLELVVVGNGGYKMSSSHFDKKNLLLSNRDMVALQGMRPAEKQSNKEIKRGAE